MTFLSNSDNDRDFVLHERLARDGVAVTDWPLCRVLLLNEADFPWLVLVPRRGGLRVSQRLEDIFQPDKINVAALAAVSRAPLPTGSLPRPML